MDAAVSIFLVFLSSLFICIITGKTKWSKAYLAA